MPDTTPPLDPRPGDYDSMLDRAADRRRTRRVRGLAVAAPALTLAVALSALPGNGSESSLRPATGAGAYGDESPEPSPQPSPSDPETTPAPSEEPGEEPGEEPSEEPGEGTEPEPSPSSEPGEEPDPEPSGSPHPKFSPSPSRSRTSPRPTPIRPGDAAYWYLSGEAPADCRTEGGATSAPDTANWCAVYAGDTEVDRGTTVDLPFRLCRSATAPAGRVTRYGDSWAKARAVAGDGEVPWYAASAKKPTVPVIEVAAGDCVQWTFHWEVAVTPGEYQLNPVFIVEEYKVPAEHNHFPVTVRG